jgi:hypothetical protein
MLTFSAHCFSTDGRLKIQNEQFEHAGSDGLPSVRADRAARSRLARPYV